MIESATNTFVSSKTWRHASECSWLSIPMGSTSADSSNLQLKALGEEKASRKFLKSKTWICFTLATIYTKFALYYLSFYWRVIALQNFVFCQTSTLISHAAAAKSLQSCPTICDPIDCSPPGSAVPRILQAEVYIYTFWTSHPSPAPSHPSRLIQSPYLSFLNHVENSPWLSISHMVMQDSMLFFPYISICIVFTRHPWWLSW